MLTGNKVSAGVEGYIFTDANENIVKQLNVDEMKTWLKEMDVDPDPTKGVTHRRFTEGVGITGKPNARP